MWREEVMSGFSFYRPKPRPVFDQRHEYAFTPEAVSRQHLVAGEWRKGSQYRFTTLKETSP